MLVGEHAFVMLLSREKFAEFAKLPIADPTTHTLALYCFSVSSRDEVDTVSAAALAAGGSEADDAEDYGFMYSRSFFDLDGHGWQVMWMDPAAASRAPRRSRPPCRTPRPQPDEPPLLGPPRKSRMSASSSASARGPTSAASATRDAGAASRHVRTRRSYYPRPQRDPHQTQGRAVPQTRSRTRAGTERCPQAEAEPHRPLRHSCSQRW